MNPTPTPGPIPGPTPQPTPNPQPLTQRGVPGMFIFGTAIAVLLAFGFLVWWMLAHTSANDVTWTRQIYLYGSVEAIVFAAAGALFGVQVKRAETSRAQMLVSQATRDAHEAKQSAHLAEADAEKGRTIAATARSLAASGRPLQPTDDGRGGRGGGDVSAMAALEAMARVADELFPPPAAVPPAAVPAPRSGSGG